MLVEEMLWNQASWKQNRIQNLKKNANSESVTKRVNISAETSIFDSTPSRSTRKAWPVKIEKLNLIEIKPWDCC